MIQVCPLKSPALQELGKNCRTTNWLAISGALSCLPCYFLGPPCECVLFISFLCLNVKHLGKTYAKDLKGEITCTELRWKGRVWRWQVFTLSLLSGGTRTGSASHWCGIGFRWHEASGSCMGCLQCWASVILLTPGSSGKRTWLVFLALTCCDFFSSGGFTIQSYKGAQKPSPMELMRAQATRMSEDPITFKPPKMDIPITEGRKQSPRSHNIKPRDLNVLTPTGF